MHFLTTSPRHRAIFFPPATGRNYTRFAALAGVRGEGPDPKGFPADASELARMLEKEWDGDGHSFSHMSLEEATNIFTTTQDENSITDFGKKFPKYFFFGVEHEDGFENFRIVFWFDN
jgi:hypothetical protein